MPNQWWRLNILLYQEEESVLLRLDCLDRDDRPSAEVKPGEDQEADSRQDVVLSCTLSPRLENTRLNLREAD